MRRQPAPVLVVAVVALAWMAAAIAAVSPKVSSTTFASSAREVTEGSAVTLTATVSAMTPADGVPSGTVEFFDGATSLGSATLADVDGRMEGAVTLTLALGPHPITVKYSGDATFAGSVTRPEFVLVVSAE